eukprot:scaffold7071_cov260-Pinguiococcus_pyrenoidosus.AAC.5
MAGHEEGVKLPFRDGMNRSLNSSWLSLAPEGALQYELDSGEPAHRTELVSLARTVLEVGSAAKRRVAFLFTWNQKRTERLRLRALHTYRLVLLEDALSKPTRVKRRADSRLWSAPQLRSLRLPSGRTARTRRTCACALRFTNSLSALFPNRMLQWRW